MSASPDRVNSDVTPARSWWLFLAGLAVFIAFQTGLVLDVQLKRSLPPEAKDAYRYIYNAVQLREGFNYDTPALKDFRVMTDPEPGDSAERRNLKWIEYHSLFFTHYILHSALLLAISGLLGVSLGTAYKITCVLGSLLIAGAISYFLLTITDRLSAGIALASMALTIFPMQGIHYVVPTNMCLALGLIMVAVLLRTGGRSPWILFALSLVSIWLHRAGVIYAGLGVMTSAILRYHNKEGNATQIILGLLPTLILIVISILIIFIFPLPLFRLAPMAAPPDTSYINEVWLNFIELLKLFGNWFLAHGVVIWPKPLHKLINNNWLWSAGVQLFGLSLIIFSDFLKRRQQEKYQKIRWTIFLIGILILIPVLSAIVLVIILRQGWLCPPQEKRSSFYVAFFLFFFILLPSLLHVLYIAEWKHPMTRADLTGRLWIPFAVVLAAAFGRGLYLVFQGIRAASYDFLPQKLQDAEMIKALTRKPRYVWAVFLAFLMIGYAPRLAQAYVHRLNIKSYMLFRQNVIFDPDQVQYTYNNSDPQDIILYDDDFIRHYFLSHGGLWRRALYIPLFPLPESFPFKPGDVRYEISWNPYLFLYRFDYERAIQYPLTISAGSTFTLTLEPHFEPGEILILPGSGTTGQGSARLQIIRENAAGVAREQEVDLEGNKWQSFPLIPEQGGTLSLVNLDPVKPFFLAGLKFGGPKNPDTLWPWQGVTQAALLDKQLKNQRSALLENTIIIKDIPYRREVIQDRGSTVLWRLKPEKGE